MDAILWILGDWRGPQPLSEILAEIERVLNANSLEFEFDGNYSFICEKTKAPSKASDPISFEIEVCRLQRMNMLCVKFKRISGSFWSYQRLCSKLVGQLVL